MNRAFIVDPWVAERRTLVAEQAGSVVAAALLVRHRDDPDVGETFRNTGDNRWLLFRPMRRRATRSGATGRRPPRP